MIVDAHAHLGVDTVFDVEQTEKELLDLTTRYGVTKSIVQPFVPRPYLEDTKAIHDRIHRLTKDKPGTFYGMASINPHLKAEDYTAEAKRCIHELAFVGLKMTPIAHAINPPSKDGRYVFETAQSLNVPLMIHTGSGAPFADPARLLDIVGEFPDVPIVLAHAGTDLYFSQALYLARTNEHVYLEPSWLSILCVQEALKVIGASKLMFSSDHAINIPVELAKYQTAARSDKELEQILSGTALSIYNLKD